MKKYFYGAISALMFLLSTYGCSNDLGLESPSDDVISRTYRSSLSEGTKTYLHGSGKVDWSKGDVVSYYTSDMGNIGTFEIEEDCHRAAIEVQMSTSDDYLVAVYGCNSIVDNRRDGFTLSGIAGAVQDGSFGSAYVSVARTTDVTSEYLSFSTVVGMIMFSIESSDVSYIQFTATDGTVISGSGGAEVSFTDDGITTRFLPADNGNSIKVNVNGLGTYYLSTLPCSISGFKIELYGTGDKKLGELSSEKLLELKSGRVINLGWIESRPVHAVDMGLSVKWASCNVGASTPEEYGDYYAWGETETKSSYVWNTYFDSIEGSDSLFYKYYHDGGKTILDPEDDVAHVKWGGSWRMPADNEWRNLGNSCDYERITLNCVNGIKFTSRINGNSIFLPAAGVNWNNRVDDIGSQGHYWLSSLAQFSDGSYSHFARGFSLRLDEDYVGGCSTVRYAGFSIRPVSE